MLTSTHLQVRNTIKFYLKHKQPFRYTIQNETISVQSKWGSYTSFDKSYTIDEINFIKKVKNYVRKNEIALEFSGFKSRKIMYFKYGNKIKPGLLINDCINIDLTGAYWNTAYKLGVVTKELYKEGLGFRKQVRLSTIGSLAKKTRIYEYDGHKQKLIQKKNSDDTAILWDVVCDSVSQLLMDTAKACGQDFIFFWVDGIYVRKRSRSIVEKIFKKHGYEYKISEIKSIEVTDRTLFVNLIKPEKKVVNGTTILKTRKPFPYRSPKTSKTFKGYNSNL